MGKPTDKRRKFHLFTIPEEGIMSIPGSDVTLLVRRAGYGPYSSAVERRNRPRQVATRRAMRRIMREDPEIARTLTTESSKILATVGNEPSAAGAESLPSTELPTTTTQADLDAASAAANTHMLKILDAMLEAEIEGGDGIAGIEAAPSDVALLIKGIPSNNLYDDDTGDLLQFSYDLAVEMLTDYPEILTLVLQFAGDLESSFQASIESMRKNSSTSARSASGDGDAQSAQTAADSPEPTHETSSAPSSGAPISGIPPS